MKTTDKISLIAVVIGIAAGLGLAYLLPGAHWGVHVAFAVIVMTGAYQVGIKQVATERAADGEMSSKENG